MRTHSMPRTYARGVREHTTLCTTATRTAFTRGRELREERSTQARLEPALEADLAGSMAEEAGFMVEDFLRAAV